MREEIKARLRKKRPAPIPVNMSHQVYKNPDGPEAADHIEALEAENARLRGALELYVEDADCDICERLVSPGNAARAALSQDKEQET